MTEARPTPAKKKRPRHIVPVTQTNGDPESPPGLAISYKALGTAIAALAVLITLITVIDQWKTDSITSLVTTHDAKPAHDWQLEQNHYQRTVNDETLKSLSRLEGAAGTGGQPAIPEAPEPLPDPED